MDTTKIAPIGVTHGATWGPHTLPLTNRDDGLPYDFTGADVVLTVKRRTDRRGDDAGALFQLTVGDGITIDDPESGVMTVTITDERTDALEAGTTYRYDVRVRKDGRTDKPIGGPFLVAPDVTRS